MSSATAASDLLFDSTELVGFQPLPAPVSTPEWNFQDQSLSCFSLLAKALEFQVLFCLLFSGEGNGNPLQHSWNISWTEEPGRLQSMGSQSWIWLSNFTFTFPFYQRWKCVTQIGTLNPRPGLKTHSLPTETTNLVSGFNEAQVLDVSSQKEFSERQSDRQEVDLFRETHIP